MVKEAGVSPCRWARGIARGLVLGCALAGVGAGCGGPKRVPAPAPHGVGVPKQDGAETIRLMVEEAWRHVGKRYVEVEGRAYRFDCSGFVRGIYSLAGVDVFGAPAENGANGVALIHEFFARYGRNHDGPPQPGDVVYFDDTYDKNRDGELDDRLTHIGIVAAVEGDRAVFIHRGSRGIGAGYLGLRDRDAPRLPSGQVLNSYLRYNHPWPDKPRAAGRLLAGYGRLFEGAGPARIAAPLAGEDAAPEGQGGEDRESYVAAAEVSARELGAQGRHADARDALEQALLPLDREEDQRRRQALLLEMARCSMRAGDAIAALIDLQRARSEGGLADEAIQRDALLAPLLR